METGGAGVNGLTVVWPVAMEHKHAWGHVTVPNLQMGVHFAQAKNLKQKLVYYQDVQLVNILSLSKVSLLFYKSKNLVNMIKNIFIYFFLSSLQWNAIYSKFTLCILWLL